jgi:hypothetical protein
MPKEFFAAVALSIGICGVSRAAVVYTNLGPGDSYANSSGLSVDAGHSVAASFIPTSSANLAEVDLALQYINGGSRTATMLLAADNAGSPGETLENLSDATAIAQFGTTNTDSLAVSLSTAHTPLVAGTRYWIIAEGQHNPTTNINTLDSRNSTPPATIRRWIQDSMGRFFRRGR